MTLAIRRTSVLFSLAFVLCAAYTPIVSAATAPATNPSFPFTIGAQEPEITNIQQSLYSLGYLKVKPTGYYGPATKAAVATFQKASKLTPNGVFDDRTRIELGKAYAQKPSQGTVLGATTSPAGKAIFPLRQGVTSTAVMQVQQALQQLGYLKTQATGYFGNLTKAALSTFQEVKSIATTGEYTQVTHNNLFAAVSKSFAGTTSAITLDFSSSLSTVEVNSPFTLKWSATGVTRCTASREWTGSVGVFGTKTLTASTTGEHTYLLTCSRRRGSVTKSVVITAVNAPTPVPDPVVIPPTPPPPPPPTPTPAGTAVTSAAFDGDSISIYWSGNWTGIYAATRPDIKFSGFAVGGSGINNMNERWPNVAASGAKAVIGFIGANDLGNPQDYANAIFAYADRAHAAGMRVVWATIIAEGHSTTLTDAQVADFNSRAYILNSLLRGAVGTHIDGLIPFDSSPELGTFAGMSVMTNSTDGVHPGGLYPLMATIAKPYVDAVLNGTKLPETLPAATSFTQTPPPTVSPTQEGLPSIASNFDINSELVPSWGTGQIAGSGATGSSGDVGAFRFICNPSHEAYNDPIVYPGQPGASHLHEFFGNTLTDANSTYSSLRTTGLSTCNSPLNRSAYWIPAMINGNNMVVRPDYVSIYYKNFPNVSPACTALAPGGCINIPRGLRYVFGFNMLNPNSAVTGEGYFNCDGPTAVGAHYPTLVEAARNCPTAPTPVTQWDGSVQQVYNHIGAIISSPPCWDGKNLDSADHRSHVAYTVPSGRGDGQNVCPVGYPYLLPIFTLGAWYTVDSTLDTSGVWDGTKPTWHLSSDVMSNGTVMKPGTSFHADWFGAWDDTVLKMWADNCINKLLNCSGGDLGNGKQLKMFSGFTWAANPRLVPIPARQ